MADTEADTERGIFPLIEHALDDSSFEKRRLIFNDDELFRRSIRSDVFKLIHVTCILPKNSSKILSVKIIAPHTIPIDERDISDLIRSCTLKHQKDTAFSFTLTPIEVAVQRAENQTVYPCQFLHARYHIDDPKIFEQIGSLEADLKLLFSQKSSLLPLVWSRDVSREEKILELRRIILSESRETPVRELRDVLEELHRFLLAVDTEFILLRSLEQATQVVRTHFLLRKNVLSSTNELVHDPRAIVTHAFPSVIKYAFGTRNALSIVISLSHLDEYERLGSSHLLEAVQCIIPDVTLVPQSFYSYGYPQESGRSFYLEVERKNAAPFAPRDVKKINQQLNTMVHKAIEPVISRIDIPVNEEEHVRNILLLSQELKRRTDRPQLVLQFVKQHETTLEFCATIMQVRREGDAIDIESITWTSPSDYIHITPLSSSIVGYIRGKYPKQVLSCAIQCDKKPFSRPNKTIDYIRAREYIITILQKLFGPIRDINGGLIGQHKKFLSELRERLMPHEVQESECIESLFLNMSSSIVKSLLSHDVLLLLYRSMKQKASKYTHCFQKGVLPNFCCFFFSSKHKIAANTLFKKISSRVLSEHDIALTHFCPSDGLVLYCLLVREGSLKQSLEEIESQVADFIAQSHVDEKKSIRISLPGPTLLLDPRVGTDRTSGIVIKLLYEGLMRLDRDGKPRSALAEAIIISQDRKQYLFQLRKSTWSNGLAVTAYDFEYAWKKILDPAFKTVFDYLFHPIRNAREVKAGVRPIDELGVYARNASELLVDLEIPAPYFLELLCHWIYSPLSKEVDVLHPGWAHYVDDTYVSNGPFRLTKWKRESEIQIVKNEWYWDATSVKLDRIDIAIIEDPKTAFELYTQGQLDWIGSPLTEIPMEVLRTKHKHILSHPTSSVQLFALNVQRTPFQSKKVRTAFYLALNKQAIIDEILFGDESPAYSILPDKLSSQMAPRTEWDLARARQLFEEGLAELAIRSRDDVPPLKLTVYDPHLIASIAQAVKVQWEAAFGISIQMEVLSWHKYLNTLHEFDHDIVGMMWYQWFFDPIYTFETLSSLSNGMNVSQWHNPAFLSIFRQAQQETSEKDRRNLLAQLETIVMEELPLLPVFEHNLRYMKNDRLSNIHLSHVGNVDFKCTELGSVQE